MFNQRTILERLEKNLSKIMLSASDPGYWALDRLGIDLYDNQLEIVNDVCDLNVENLAILGARGNGKSHAVAVGIVKLCSDIPKFKVGVFGPKAEQATRIIKVIKEEILTPSSPAYHVVRWKESTTSKLTFVNGSEIQAISAAEATMQEGFHFWLVVLDEAHRISDISVNQRIIPMLGSFPIAKMVKLGISMYKQNFWKSCCHPNTMFKVLKRDWTESPLLLRKGSIIYKGKELPKYVIDQMPLTLKEKLFPDRPDLHYDGNMTELDFKTQYAMEWTADINLELNEEDQQKLVDSTHEILTRGKPELQERYFFGLDTAAGTMLPGRRDLDFTALSIWRKRGDNIKEKVAGYQWQGNVLDQMKEIRQIVHPTEGFFSCVFGLVDYSNIGINIVEAFKAEGIPVEGIMFNSTESASHKNFKNAMFDQFKFELQSRRIKYPSLEQLDNSVVFKKGFNEWVNVERHKSLGINDKIEAPVDMHDDHVCSDIMAIWAADKTDTFKVYGVQSTYKIPDVVTGVASVAGRGVSIGQQQKNRYLPDNTQINK